MTGFTEDLPQTNGRQYGNCYGNSYKEFHQRHALIILFHGVTPRLSAQKRFMLIVIIQPANAPSASAFSVGCRIAGRNSVRSVCPLLIHSKFHKIKQAQHRYFKSAQSRNATRPNPLLVNSAFGTTLYQNLNSNVLWSG